MATETQDKPKKITRLFKGEVEDVSESKRTITHKITTDVIDRYKEVIVGKGVKLDNYRSNPVVLWGHDHAIVIGKNLWTKLQTKDGRTSILAKTLFAKTEFAEEVFQLYATGFLNGWSIGGTPDWKKAGPPTEDEIKARPELKNCYCMYRCLELYEYSACSVPANPEALGNEVGKKLSAGLRKQIEDGERWDLEGEQDTASINEEPTMTTAEFEAELERRVKIELEKRKAEGITKTLELPPLIGRTFEQELARTKLVIAGLTSGEAAERAARELIDRQKGRV